MFCSQCGAQQVAGSRFCQACGKSLAAGPPPIPSAQPTAPPPPPVQGAGMPSGTARPKKRFGWGKVALGIGLGFLGGYLFLKSLMLAVGLAGLAAAAMYGMNHSDGTGTAYDDSSWGTDNGNDGGYDGGDDGGGGDD